MRLVAFSRPLYDLLCAGLGAQSSRWARISVNRLLKIWKPVPMSVDITVSRSRTWHFSHTLYTSLKPEAYVQQAQLIHGT
jgi:hypothetical protein